MIIDSHCHLDRLKPVLENGDLDSVLANARAADVTHQMCISVELSTFPDMMKVIDGRENIWASLGLHPCYEVDVEPTTEELVALSDHPQVIAIGETGLDYFMGKREPQDPAGFDWQRERFRRHIQASIETQKPFIVHTRAAADDTIQIMREELGESGQAPYGLIHCFSENWDFAKAALDLGLYISISGIVTFHSADMLRDVVKKLPMDRILVETDAPWLAPVPHRGKENEPAFTRHVVEKIAELRGMDWQDVAQQTTDNFCRLFNVSV